MCSVHSAGCVAGWRRELVIRQHTLSLGWGGAKAPKGCFWGLLHQTAAWPWKRKSLATSWAHEK